MPTNSKFRKDVNQKELENSSDDETAKINQTIADYLQSRMLQNDNDPLDSLGYFFKSMESLVRTFSEQRQLEIKSKISTMLQEAEANELTEQSWSEANRNHPSNTNFP